MSRRLRLVTFPFPGWRLLVPPSASVKNFFEALFRRGRRTSRFLSFVRRGRAYCLRDLGSSRSFFFRSPLFRPGVSARRRREAHLAPRRLGDQHVFFAPRRFSQISTKFGAFSAPGATGRGGSRVGGSSRSRFSGSDSPLSSVDPPPTVARLARQERTLVGKRAPTWASRPARSFLCFRAPSLTAPSSRPSRSSGSRRADGGVSLRSARCYERGVSGSRTAW